MNEDGFGLNFKELLLSHLSKSEIQLDILSGQYVGESFSIFYKAVQPFLFLYSIMHLYRFGIHCFSW